MGECSWASGALRGPRGLVQAGLTRFSLLSGEDTPRPEFEGAWGSAQEVGKATVPTSLPPPPPLLAPLPQCTAPWGEPPTPPPPCRAEHSSGPAVAQWARCECDIVRFCTMLPAPGAGMSLTDPASCNMVLGGFKEECYLQLVEPGVLVGLLHGQRGADASADPHIGLTPHCVD